MLNRYYYQSSGAAEHGSDTIYATAGESNSVQCLSATYANAHDGTGTLSLTSDYRAGQTLSTNYYCWECLLTFDLSSVPSGASITSATLSLKPFGDYTTTEFIMRVRTYDFGASVGTADYVSGDDLSSTGTLVATYDTTSGWSGGYKTFTDVALAANLVPATKNRFIVYSSRHEAETQPAGNEYGYIDHVTDLPKLEVIW